MKFSVDQAARSSKNCPKTAKASDLYFRGRTSGRPSLRREARSAKQRRQWRLKAWEKFDHVSEELAVKPLNPWEQESITHVLCFSGEESVALLDNRVAEGEIATTMIQAWENRAMITTFNKFWVIKNGVHYSRHLPACPHVKFTKLSYKDDSDDSDPHSGELRKLKVTERDAYFLPGNQLNTTEQKVPDRLSAE
ncbi:MAG: hypothetical protein M1831_006745 [Alyxoria varia]|nr:MAG: hypothetical protein M1831_006745 [Alyxoria varia]